GADRLKSKALPADPVSGSLRRPPIAGTGALPNSMDRPMSILSISLISVLAGWIVFATALAFVRGRALRRTRQEHADEQERSTRYRLALQRREEQVAAAVA